MSPATLLDALTRTADFKGNWTESNERYASVHARFFNLAQAERLLPAVESAIRNAISLKS